MNDQTASHERAFSVARLSARCREENKCFTRTHKRNMHTQMKPKDLIDWRDHATQEELDRVLEITANRLAGTQEIAAIRNRCYQRARRKEGKN